MNYENSLATMSPVFDLKLILEVIKASNLLIDKTNKNDILIFIGQSPDYLSHIVKTKRRVISVPFSGRPFGDEYSTPDDDNIYKYCDFLRTLGINETLLQSENVILVDHTHSGQSPELFVKVLQTCFNCYECFKFINIVSNLQYNLGAITSSRPAYIQTIGYLLMPNLVAFANEGNPNNSEHTIPRSVPHYPHWKWNSPPDYSGLIEGTFCAKKILLYYYFLNRFYENFNDGNFNDGGFINYFKNILLNVIDKNDKLERIGDIDETYELIHEIIVNMEKQIDVGYVTYLKVSCEKVSS